MIAKDALINGHAIQFSERCKNNGISLNSKETKAISILIRKMFEFELWEKFVAIYPFVGRSPISHSFNLKNILRHTIKWFNQSSLIHDQYGVTNIGNGYGNTFVAPGLFSDNDIHISVYNATYWSYLNPYSPVIGSSLPYDFSNRNNTQNKWIHTIHLKYPTNNGAWTYSCGKVSSNTSMAGEDAGDFLHAQVYGLVAGVNGDKCYLNGKQFGFYDPQRSGKSVPLNKQVSDPIEGISYDWTPHPFMIFTNRAFGDPSVGYANANLRFVSIGYSLTDKDNENLYNIIQEFQSILGRDADQITITPDDFTIKEHGTKTQLSISEIYEKPIFEKTNILHRIDNKLTIADIKAKGPRRVYVSDNINMGISLQSFEEI